MSTLTKLFLTLGLSMTTMTLLACEQEGPLERAGEEMDEAADDAGDAIEDAADEVEDAAEELEDDLEKK